MLKESVGQSKKMKLETKKLLELRESIDSPIWWIGDSYEDQEEGEIAIHSPERGCIATLAVEWEHDGSPIEQGLADAELMCLAPELLDEVLHLREENEYLREQIRFMPKD